MRKALTFFHLLALTLLLSACDDKAPLSHLETATITSPRGSELKVLMAISHEDQKQGLSGIQDQDWPDSQGLFFAYEQIGRRRFWMPDTYFDLDIIFLDPDLSIVHIERGVKAHPGRDESASTIQQTPEIYAQHVLELKAETGLTKDWRIGQRLSWKGPRSLASYLSGK